MLKKTLSSGVCLALGVGALISLQGTTASAGRDTTTTPTPFAMSASGYGSRIRGGSVPGGSDSTAFASIGCTNKAGLSQSNRQVGVNLGGGLRASVIETRVWTKKKNGVVSSNARNSIARVNVGNDGGLIGDLSLRGITSRSKAFHNGSGFHARTRTSIGSIVLNRPILGDRIFDPPTRRGQTVNVLGLLKVTLGKGKRSSNADGAKASAFAVTIEVLATDTKVKLAKSEANINRGIKRGVFAGQSYASRLNALEGTVTSGKTPLVVMPCQGTKGKLQKRSIAFLDPGRGLRLNGLDARQRSSQTVRKAEGFEQGTVAKVRLGNLVVEGIRGRAHVTRTVNGVTKDANGTHVARVSFRGERLTFGNDGVIRIAGLAKLENKVINRRGDGISVTALRITLLRGDLAVVELGHAQLRIKPTGL